MPFHTQLGRKSSNGIENLSKYLSPMHLSVKLTKLITDLNPQLIECEMDTSIKMQI